MKLGAILVGDYGPTGSSGVCSDLGMKLGSESLEDRAKLTMTPSLNMQPTIVVPVLVAFGRGIPFACRATLRVWLEKSKPGIMNEMSFRSFESYRELL